ncbi:MAG: hypothetical protein ABUT20_28155 [Bacteroidota bacterium]
MTFRKKSLRIGLILTLLFLVASEIILRLKWGFCDAVLFREDKDYEYIAIPQKRVRFGNHIFYNSLSQRNDELSESDSVRILFFGDSVINGGTQTDQDSLATTKLSRYLTLKYKKPVKVLNISAGSWGPDNCFAYLKQKGNFDAKEIVLVVSSHDAYDDMTFSKTVNAYPNYPSKQYTFATAELLQRYIFPRLFQTKATTELDNLLINKKTANSMFNSGFENFLDYTTSHKIPFTVYLHADRQENEDRRYNSQGMEIIDFCSKKNIPIIKELDFHLDKENYRDEIHLNNNGQRKLFEIVRDSL